MAKIRIGCVIPIQSDPTSFYRAIGPFSQLCRKHDEINLFFLPEAPAPHEMWVSLKQIDILFLQRPCIPQHFNWLVCAKDMRVPVWVDFDDDNLSVPKDNPTYHQYNQLAVKDSIVKLARNCDVLTVSTGFLKKKYGIYNANTHVIPNALDDSLMHFKSQMPAREREKKFLWRGNSSHQRNLMSVGKEILAISAKHQDWRWVFFGCEPLDLTENMKNVEFIGPVSMYDYFKVMLQVNSSVLFYPLAKNDHAMARSHISWLEGTFSGNVVLASSQNDELRRPGAINFESPKEFNEKCEAICNGDIDFKAHVEQSWNEIQEKYMLSKMNELREGVIEQLLTAFHGAAK